MSVLNELATSLGRNDEGPNKALGIRLAAKRDMANIRVLCDNLEHKNKVLRHNIMDTLHTISETEPGLLKDRMPLFAALLKHKDNRMIWSAMSVISEIARAYPQDVWPYAAAVAEAMENGSVITIDRGVSTLARLAAAEASYNRELFPLLTYRLMACPAKQVPQYAEKTLEAVNDENRDSFTEVLKARLHELTPAQAKRVEKVLKKAG